MEQFEEVEVVKALKKHTDTMRELTDQQYKASKALDVLFKYKTNKLNVNTTRDIDDFTGKTLGVPFLSEQLINSLGDVLQREKETIEKQLELYVKKLDRDLSTGTFDQSEIGITLVVDEKIIGHATATALAKQALEEAELNVRAFNEPHKMPNDYPSGATRREEYKKLQEENESIKSENQKLYYVVAEKNKELEELKSKYNILNDNFMKYKSSNRILFLKEKS